MLTPPPLIRIANSIEAIGICWFISGIAWGFLYRDPRVAFLFFFWSLPFLALAWVLVGIPLIAMGNRIIRIPKVFLGIGGAIAGTFVMLFFFVAFSVIANGTINLKGFKWSFLKGWPAFAPGIGASVVILYSQLLSREIKRASAKT
jgi:hypothetical protein